MVDFTRISDNLPGKRQKFQDMIQAIAIAIDGAQPVEGSGGDTGLDAFVGRIGGDIVSYEAKYFEGRLNSNRRAQVKRSLNTAKKKHPNLKKWILATPITFTTGEHTWWQDLVDANPSIEMVLWQALHIENHLNSPTCAGIREEYFPSIVDEIRASSTRSIQEHQQILSAVERSSQREHSIQNNQQFIESGIQEILSRMPASETSLEAQKAQEIQRRLEEAKRILNEHKPRTALSLYESILDEIQEGSKALLSS